MGRWGDGQGGPQLITLMHRVPLERLSAAPNLHKITPGMASAASQGEPAGEAAEREGETGGRDAALR